MAKKFKFNIKFDKLKKFKFNKKVTVIAVIAVLLISGAGYSYFVKAKKANVKQVTTSKVVKKKLTQMATATGNIEAKYRNDIALNPSQKVAKVLVSEGQEVKKGDVLLKLDESDYQNQLDKQKINLRNAETTLNQLSSTGSASDRSNAENGISQAGITLENTQRAYADAKKKYEQNSNLFNNGYVSKDEFDNSKKALEDAANAVRAAEASLSNSQNSLSNINNSSDDKIVNQRNQLALIKADIDNLNKKIADCDIKANTNGKVIKVDAKEDQFPKAGDMVIVDDISQYKVSVDINQYDAVKITKDQKVNIKVKGSTKKYTGVVSEIGEVAQPKVNAKSGGADQEFKVNIKVIMDNPDSDIKAGYEADVDIVLNEKPAAVSIGFDAIKEDKAAKKKYVYVVGENNKLHKKEVKTGLETDYDVEILSGLKSGEKYVINPAENLNNDDVVAEASTSKAGGSKK